MDSNKQNVFSGDDSMKIKGIAIVLMMFHHCFGSADRFEAYTISFFPFSTEQFIRIASFLKYVSVCSHSLPHMDLHSR